jgi:hypothetical protein
MYATPDSEGIPSDFKTKMLESIVVCGITGSPLEDGVLDFRVPLERKGEKSKENLQVVEKSVQERKSTICSGCTNVCQRCPLAFPETYAMRNIVVDKEEKSEEPVATLDSLFVS